MNKEEQFIYGKYEDKWVIARRRPDKGKCTYEILTWDTNESDMWRSLAFLYKDHSEFLKKHIEEIETFFANNFCYTYFEPEGLKLKDKTIFYVNVDEEKPFFPGSNEPFTWINGTPSNFDKIQKQEEKRWVVTED